MGWQPIETAPNDGTLVLIFGWEDGPMSDPRPIYAVAAHYDNYPGEPWQTGRGLDDYSSERITHWMPLPEPPVSS